MLMPILLKKLSGDDRNEIARVAKVLGGIGPPAKEALPALVAAKPTTRDHTSDAITVAIGRIDPSHPAGIPALIEDLKHPVEVFHVVVFVNAPVSPAEADSVYYAPVVELITHDQVAPVYELRNQPGVGHEPCRVG